MPLFGGGHNRIQPVYVGDVALAIAALVLGGAKSGATYELGGPQVLTMAELMEIVCAKTNRNCLLLPVPFALAKISAVFLQCLPWNIFTIDQVELLREDNVVSGEQPDLADLGVTATALDAVLPTYLFRYRKAGRISSLE